MYEGVSKLELEVEFRRRIQFWRHISATNKDIFTRFGV